MRIDELNFAVQIGDDSDSKEVMELLRRLGYANISKGHFCVMKDKRFERFNNFETALKDSSIVVLNPTQLLAKLGYKQTDGIKPKDVDGSNPEHSAQFPDSNLMPNVVREFLEHGRTDEPAMSKPDNDAKLIFDILSEHSLEMQNNLLAEVKKMVVISREKEAMEYLSKSKGIEASLIDLANKFNQ